MTRSLLVRMVAREVWQRRGAFIAAVGVAAIAAMLFVASASSSADLEQSCNDTYARLRFMDFLVRVADAPDHAVDLVRQVPGVEAAEPRRTGAVRVPVPAGVPTESARLLDGRVHSVPADHHPAVDDLAIEDGRYLSGARGELLMETRFARAHGYRVGQRVQLVSDGAAHDFTLVGLVSSPEFLWISKSTQDPRPTATLSAVLFASDADVRDLHGGFLLHEIHVRATPGADRAQVMQGVARAVDLWRDGPPVERQGLASYAALRINRLALGLLASIFPTAFALLGCFTLAAAMRFLMLAQRRALGILSSLGMQPRELAVPWIAVAAVLGAVGGALGAAVGVPLGIAITRFYTGVIGLPFISADLHPLMALISVAVLAAVSAAACALGIRGEVRRPPLAMLAGAVDEGARDIALERMWPALGRLPLRLRMPLRNVLRHRARSAMAGLGIGCAVMQAVLTLSLLDSQRDILRSFFEDVHHWSFYVSLRDPVDRADLPPIDRWPGVQRAEAALRIVARVTVGGRSMTLPLLGMPSNASLVRQVDDRGTPLPMTGLFLVPAAMAELRAHPGDVARVQLTAPEGEQRPIVLVPVAAALHEPIALISRLPLSAVERVVGRAAGTPTDAVNTLLLAVDPAQMDAVRRRLDHWDDVGGVTDLVEERGDVRYLLGLMDAYGWVLLAFAAALAFVLVTTATIIGVLERRREMALLQALGLSDGERAAQVAAETGIVWALAVLPGIGLGAVAGQLALGAYRNVMLQMQLTLSPLTMAAAALASLGLCVAAALLALRARPSQSLRETLDSR